MTKTREVWGSRLGVILAVAGSAVGLGNFLRFPVQAAQNGGGAFMIPYFVAFLLLGIPLCWVEWTMGRYGGKFSHGSAPGIFQAIWCHPIAKYIGAIGIFGPLLIYFYYIYIESWTLGYAFYSITGKLGSLRTKDEIATFLDNYLDMGADSSIVPAYIFFLITFGINFGIIYFGVSRGIERVSKVAMPCLAILGIILAVRVLTLGTPDPAHPDWNVKQGLGFIWNPNFAALKDPNVWLAAAGQIFFTLSLGIGAVLTYASYLKPKDDVVLSGLSASSANEFMEVIIGSSVVIVAAVAFFGNQGAVEVAKSGAFNLSFVTMPLIFTKLFAGSFFSLAWFLLLFFAGLTSSISLLQPSISFLEDEFKFPRRKAVLALAALCFLMSQFSVFGLKYGLVDEMDFWGGTFLLVLFGFIEVVFFAWIFGIDKGWRELHQGAHIQVPIIFKFIIKYVTPLYVGVILVAWLYKNFLPTLLLQKEEYANNVNHIIILRIILLLIFIGLLFLIHYAWRHHRKIKVESR